MEMESYSCDLSAKLYTSTRVFERALPPHWLLFAPDRPGFPVLVDRGTHDLLQAFHGGATVGHLLSTRPSLPLDHVISTAGFLEERGFLRSSPDPARYEVSPSAFGTPPRQFSVWLHVNNGCNLACDYCFVRDQSPEVMRPEDLQIAVDRIAATAIRHGVVDVTIKFAGGEPTLVVGSLETAYDRLTAALRGTSTKLHFVVLSNGTVATDRVLAFLRRPDVGIGISVDGHGDFHDLHRVFPGRRGSWDVIRRNIERLRREGITPHIMTTLTKESAPGLPRLAEWIFGQGLAARFNVVRPHYGESDSAAHRQAEHGELARCLQDAFERLFAMIDASLIDVDVARQLNVCELSFDNPLDGPACGIGVSHVVMNHHGRLADCVMTVNAPTTEGSEDLLTAVRGTVHYSPWQREDGGACGDCPWFPVCGGGCPTANTRVNGHPYTRSPLCAFYQYVIPRYLECLGRQMWAQARREGSGKLDPAATVASVAAP